MKAYIEVNDKNVLHSKTAEELSFSMLIQRVKDKIGDDLAEVLYISDLEQSAEATNEMLSAAA